VGYWDTKEDVIKNWTISKVFDPNMEDEVREQKVKGWNKAVKCSFGWAKDE
jgi:glycerol kinase